MSDSHFKDRQVRRVILIEGTVNLIVLTGKLGVGLSTGSMAILADAVHSLADVTNNIIALVVMRFAIMPADRNHPYGHRKMETLAVFVLASILVVLAFEIVINSFKRSDAVVVSSDLELGIMLVVLLMNVSVTSWQHHWAKRLDSDILRADAFHTFADVLITSVVIIGWQLSALGYAWIDRLCAVLVAVIVLYLAYSLFRRAVPVLIDESAINPEELANAVKKVEGVREVYNIRSRWIGKASAIELVISVDSSLSIQQSHGIADAVENLLEKQFGASNISIHVEPFKLKKTE